MFISWRTPLPGKFLMTQRLVSWTRRLVSDGPHVHDAYFGHLSSFYLITRVSNYADLGRFCRTGDQDELTRLRKRVLELEHTVRVLTQRHSPREAFDQKVLQPGSSRPQGSAEEDAKGKKPRDPSSSSSNSAGQPQPGTLIPGQSSSPST